eukprot:gene32620-43588_t
MIDPARDKTGGAKRRMRATVSTALVATLTLPIASRWAQRWVDSAPRCPGHAGGMADPALLSQREREIRDSYNVCTQGAWRGEWKKGAREDAATNLPPLPARKEIAPVAAMPPLPPLALPWPALHASHGGIWIAQPDGNCRTVGRGEAIRLAADTPMIMLGAPLIGQRLGHAELSGLDLLELYAFLFPARFMVPTPRGLARATGLEVPGRDEEVAPFLLRATAALLDTAGGDWPEREGAWTSLQSLLRLRWPWTPALIDRIRKPVTAERWLFSKLPEWSEAAPRPAPRSIVVDPAQTAERLAKLAGAAIEAFAPRMMRDAPNLVLAEAGTGIGKTLGYLAPASLWAEQAGGAVWVSTFTKALQRQLAQETTRLFPDAEVRRAKVVTRKGRENYLCLLNLEDALQGGFAGRAAILAQLVARWAAYSAEKDGDDWVINGQKIWTSGAHYSDYGILITRTDPNVAKHKGLTMFFLDMKSPGVEIKPIKQANGQSEFNEVYFTDVKIPDSQRLGKVGDGWNVSLTTLMNERMSIGARQSTGFPE